MRDLPGTLRQFCSYIDAAPAWRLDAVRRCVRECLDELIERDAVADALAACERERAAADAALRDPSLRDPGRRPGPGWRWRTIGADIATPDGALRRRPLECWTPPGFDHPGDLAARIQRNREALGVALIAALHDAALEGCEDIDARALAGRPMIDEEALSAVTGGSRSLGERRRRAWAGLRLYAMAERVEAGAWLDGAKRFLRASGRDDFAREASSARPRDN